MIVCGGDAPKPQRSFPGIKGEGTRLELDQWHHSGALIVYRRALIAADSERDGSSAGADLDDPRTTIARRAVIGRKRLLRRFYLDAYGFFASATCGSVPGARLEIGSGAGFLHEIMPGVIRSDVMRLPDMDVVFRAERLPFADRSLAAIYLLSTLHHIGDVAAFFGEAERCLAPGGTLAMVEPANTPWARFVYSRFHHEPFLPDAPDWRLPPGGPLSMANGALPWVVFVRDRRRFEREFPALNIRHISFCSPLGYALSGGFTRRALAPERLAFLVEAAEAMLAPFNPLIGMFMRIAIVKRVDTTGRRRR